MKILIIDDDFITQEVIKGILEDIGECETEIDSLEGVRRFEQALGDGEPYDVVVCDLLMPEIDGYEVIKRLREAEDKRNVSRKAAVILVTTVKKTEASRGLLNSMQPVDFERKPVDRDSLLQKVRGMRAAL